MRTTVSTNRTFPGGHSRTEKGGVLAVLLLAAALRLCNLIQNGYGNPYYASAVRSMLWSGHNFFFVSFDPGGFVSVDKPPVALWVQAASARLFGYHGWSVLLPQALAGIAAVGILYGMVRRVFGPVAGLMGAMALAITPVSVAVDRSNNTDSLLVLVLLLAAWAATRAAETGRLTWLLSSPVLVGVAFNTKGLRRIYPAAHPGPPVPARGATGLPDEVAPPCRGGYGPSLRLPLLVDNSGSGSRLAAPLCREFRKQLRTRSQPRL